MAELSAQVAALEAAVDGLRTVAAGMMANAAADKAALDALEARVAKLEVFDQPVKDLG